MQNASRIAVWERGPTGSSTVLAIRARAGSMRVVIREGRLAPGRSLVTVDWGDGERTTVPGFFSLEHVYLKEGDYSVRLSDDISFFAYSYTPDGDAPSRGMLLGVADAGSRVTELGVGCFYRCANLAGTVRFPNVAALGSFAFSGTTSLERIELPALPALVTAHFLETFAAELHADSAKSVQAHFFEAYGQYRLRDLYMRGLTRAEIAAMDGFPFTAPSTVRFHGSDGILMGSGRFA